jgi:hypothetical protein
VGIAGASQDSTIVFQAQAKCFTIEIFLLRSDEVQKSYKINGFSDFVHCPDSKELEMIEVSSF